MTRVDTVTTNPLGKISESEEEVGKNEDFKVEPVQNEEESKNNGSVVGRKNFLRRDVKSEEDKEKTIVFLKSIWYLVSLAVLMVIAAIIFMGIEGNHENSKMYKMLDQQFQFNLSAERILCKKHNLEPECFEDAPWLRTHFENVYRNLTLISYNKCELAELNLTSWNNKTGSEDVMYAVSIVSTVGWGVYHPNRESVVSKVVTIVYAIFGLPIFAALLGYAHEGVAALERRMMRSRWVQLYVSNTKFLGLLALLVLTVFVSAYGAICVALQREEHETRYEELLLQLHSGPGVTDYRWNLLTGIYYVFTTLSCIGFGDIYIWDPHPFVWFLKPFSLFAITVFVIALLAHAFQRAKKQVEKSFHNFAEAHLISNIAHKSIKYDREASQRHSSRIRIHFGSK